LTLAKLNLKIWRSLAKFKKISGDKGLNSFLFEKTGPSSRHLITFQALANVIQTPAALTEKKQIRESREFAVVSPNFSKNL